MAAEKVSAYAKVLCGFCWAWGSFFLRDIAACTAMILIIGTAFSQRKSLWSEPKQNGQHRPAKPTFCGSLHPLCSTLH